MIIRHIGRRSLLQTTAPITRPYGSRAFAWHSRPARQRVLSPSSPLAVRRLSSTAMAATSHAHTNALIHSTSPYLLQHAHNPVDWQTWSQSTLDRAREQHKMIFLSSGYSACHWCHVMAHESFEDEEIAALLNEHFVCVKLDREERPDVDAAYMAFIQATSGRGGWPMSVFLTSDAEPLFGGTYFSPPAFTQLIHRLSQLWQTNRQRCVASARDISAQLREVANAGVAGTGWDDLPSMSVTAKALKHWLLLFDEDDGGFGDAPKFPSPPNTFHLLDTLAAEWANGSSTQHAALSEAGLTAESAEKALDASAFTLARIARGGISDHLAGGIARYSVDDEWRVPHFEKMLYDQAQLLTSFSQAAQLCQSSSKSDLQSYVPEFVDCIEGIVSYLDRYMRDSANGSFYAAEDADSLPDAAATHAKEGAFYVWDATEIEEVLGKESEVMSLVKAHFGIKLDGNIPAQSDPHGEMVGKNILHAHVPLRSTAERLGIDLPKAEALFADAKRQLLQRREQRPRPLRDDKIITAWNALTISGLALASRILVKHGKRDVGERALQMAKDAASFVWTTMWNSQKQQFVRSYRNGVYGPAGVDVDYAYTVQAFLDLYESTFEGAYIDQALTVQAAQDALFWDDKGPGGYLISAAQSDGNVLGRQRGDQEGAEPTSTSVAAHNLLRLRSLISDLDKRVAAISSASAHSNDGDQQKLLSNADRIAQCINSGGMTLSRAPFALGMRVTALTHARLGSIQVIVVGDRGAQQTQDLLDAVQSHFVPRINVILIDTAKGVDGARATLGAALVDGNDAVRELLNDPKTVERGAFATVCQNFTCGLPISDPVQLSKQLHV